MTTYQLGKSQTDLRREMKILLGVLLVTSFVCATAAAQQKTDQPSAPDIRAKIESLVKAQSQQPVPTSDDKITVVLVRKRPTYEDFFSIRTVMIDGAAYTSVGALLIPIPGGGASGCFDPTGVETAARIERANAEWAKRPEKN